MMHLTIWIRGRYLKISIVGFSKTAVLNVKSRLLFLLFLLSFKAILQEVEAIVYVLLQFIIPLTSSGSGVVFHKLFSLCFALNNTASDVYIQTHHFPVQPTFAEETDQCLPKILNSNPPLIIKVSGLPPSSWTDVCQEGDSETVICVAVTLAVVPVLSSSKSFLRTLNKAVSLGENLVSSDICWCSLCYTAFSLKTDYFNQR